MKALPRVLAAAAGLLVAVGYAFVSKTYHFPGAKPDRKEVFATDFPGTHAGLVLIAIAAVLLLINGARRVPHPRIRGAALAFALVACVFQIPPALDWTSQSFEKGPGYYAQIAGAACVLIAAVISKE